MVYKLIIRTDIRYFQPDTRIQNNIMQITFETLPMAIEILIKEVRSLKADIDKKNSKVNDEQVVDRLEARRILGTHGKKLSEARFAQLKKEGRINTYGFGGKHFYNVEELEILKRR